MVDQPGAGTARSYKIRGHSRQRRTTKPYARPSEVKKKGLIETVRDYLSPSWFFGYFQTNEAVELVDREDSSDSDVDIIDEDATGNDLTSERNSISINPSGLPSVVEENSFLVVKEGTQVVTSSGLQEQDRISERSFEYLENNNKGELCTCDDSDKAYIDGSVSHDLVAETPAPSSLFYSSQLKRNPLPSILHSRTLTSRSFQHSGNPLHSLGSTSRTSTHSSQTPNITRVNTLSRNAVASSTGLTRSQPVAPVTSAPAFSVSTFVTPVPQTFTNKRTESPFYPGKITYGGALTNSGYSNYSGKRRKHSPGSEAYQPVRKQQIKAKPLPNATKGGNSQIAQRILEALESVSSPLKDVRRIPSPLTSHLSSPLSFSPSKTRTRPPRHFGPRVTSLQAKLLGHPPVEVLSAPEIANVTILDHREPTNPRTSSTPFPTADNPLSTRLDKSLFSGLKDTVLKTSLPSAFIPKALPTSLSPGEKSSKTAGKMRSASHGATHYSLKNNAEDEQVVNPLPEIVHAVPLPLNVDKNKPSFFSTSSKAAIVVTKSENPGKHLDVKTESTKNGFIFSTPKAKAPAASIKEAPCRADNEVSFTFSQPLSIKAKENKDMNAESVKGFSKNPPLNSPSHDLKTSTSLVSSYDSRVASATQNSLEKMFGPAPGDWECSSCMVRNKAADQKCVACGTAGASKASHKQAVNNGDISSNGINLTTMFAPEVGSWNCETCLLNNKSIALRCVACNSGKPDEKSPSADPGINKGDTIDLKVKFAPAANSWECGTCTIRNTLGDMKCIACGSAVTPETTAENDLKKKFALPSGSWECETCMINNEPSTVKCVACQTKKPGTEAGINQPVFSFGLNTPSADINSCSTTCVGGAAGTSSAPSFTFGKSTSGFASTETTTSGFTFGLRSSKEQDTTPKIAFGSRGSGQSDSKGGAFIFGGSDKKCSSNEGNGKEKETESEKEEDVNEIVKPGVQAPLNIAQAAAAGLLKVPGIDVNETNNKKAATSQLTLPLSASAILADSTSVLPVSIATTKDATPSLVTPVKTTSGTMKTTPFNFGGSAVSSTISSSTVSATTPQTSLGGNTENPDFGFSMVPAASKTTPFNFASHSSDGSDKKDGKAAFAFGNSANAIEKSATAAGVFKFGAAGHSTAVSETPSLFKNAVPVTSSVVVSETKTQSSALFTFTGKAATDVKPVFGFGNLNGLSGGHGTVQGTQAASAGNALFGFNAGQPANAENHNSLGGEEMEADSNSNHDSGQSAFGSTGGFNFTGQTPGNTSGGLFGSSGTSGTSGTAGFNFGNGGASIPTAFQFGGSSNTNNNTPSGGFNFTPGTAASAGASPFMFGGPSANSGNAPSNTSTGFNFNAEPANNATAPPFNLSQGGGGGFSVGATSTPRVIRKAVRRKQR